MDMAKRFREFRYQVQRRDNAVMQSEYEKDGVPEYSQTEWQDVLKKSYPFKTASRHFNLQVADYGRAQDVRLVDTKTGRVVSEHITEAA